MNLYVIQLESFCMNFFFFEERMDKWIGSWEVKVIECKIYGVWDHVGEAVNVNGEIFISTSLPIPSTVGSINYQR